MLKVVFRADASLEIGSGHIMRCLTLADQLQADGAQCQFICREHTGHLGSFIMEKGFEVKMLPIPLDAPHSSSIDFRDHSEALSALPDHYYWLGTTWEADAAQCGALLKHYRPDWLIVDHYALDQRWENALRKYCARIGVIDDLADRVHDCDLLVDQTLGRDASEYAWLTPAHCYRLTGANYSLLRPEFSQRRSQSLQRRNPPQLNKLLINLGGVDKDNLTGRVLNALEISRLPGSCRLSVVMGATAPHREAVVAQASKSRFPTQVAVNVCNMAELMSEADMAIGAAGSTTWERCCLGLPSIMIVLADNQRVIADRLTVRGIALALKHNAPDFEVQLAALVNTIDPTKLATLSEAAREVTTGRGVVEVSQFFQQ